MPDLLNGRVRGNELEGVGRLLSELIRGRFFLVLLSFRVA